MTIRAVDNKEKLMTGWHLDKRVSISHIISTAVLAGTILIWMFALENRVSITEHRINGVEKTETEIKNEIRNMGDTIIGKLNDIEQRQYDHVLEHNKG